MNLEYIYWWFNGVLPERWCDYVLQSGLKNNRSTAFIGDKGDKHNHSQEELNELRKIRNSDIAWLDQHWIYREIHPFIDTANENAGWNFQWNWTETAQFTEYKPGQFYGWHQDSLSQSYKNKEKEYNGKMRKLSCSILLNNSDEYEGGELQFKLLDGNKADSKIITATETHKKGSIIVFPSFNWHQVTPVTKGTRYSLVMWNLGEPWR
tara:strand:- start:483 stop:1106 length:624 start_codon:yes stop_codon:yes gene_type:complete